MGRSESSAPHRRRFFPAPHRREHSSGIELSLRSVFRSRRRSAPQNAGNEPLAHLRPTHSGRRFEREAQTGWPERTTSVITATIDVVISEKSKLES